MKTLIANALKINLLILSFGLLSCSSNKQADKTAKLELAIRSDNRPNILLIYTDDQGTLDAGCYGAKDINTPVLDKLATQGVKFTQAYSHTVCCPSRAALLTGRAPQRSGVNQWTSCNPNDQVGRVMDLKEITIAEHLKENGYKTGLIGKWHLGATMNHGPLDQGFDVFLDLEAVLSIIIHISFYMPNGKSHNFMTYTEERKKFLKMERIFLTCK